MKQYEKVIKTVCRTDWRKSSLDERDGCVAVACMLAYIQGIPSNVAAMARHLSLDVRDVDVPFRRLLINGLFSNSYAAKEDELLLGKSQDEGSVHRAWGIIAGIGSGFTGLRET